MSRVKLGTSELEISQIAFGAWAIGGWMWGGSDDRDSLRALDTAIDLGINTIDTAPAYGFGKSEELVGKAVKGKRDRVQLMTKYGLRWDSKLGEFYFPTRDNAGKPVNMHRYAAPDSVTKECEDSLRRLKTDYIDLYQIHWSDPTTPVEDTMEAVRKLMEQGKVLHAGVCNFDVENLKRAGRVIPVLSDQVPYSMVRRGIEEGTIPYCRENNISIMVYSPLQRGILTGKVKTETAFNKGDTRPDTAYYKKVNVSRINRFLEEIRPIADERSVTLPQLVLRWTLQRPGISCLLAGARTEEQLAENAGTFGFELSSEEMEKINICLDNLEIDLEA